MRLASYFLAACSLGLVATGSPARADSSLRLSSGISFSSGDYGTASKTNILSAPVRAAWRTGDFEFSASVSYITIEGTGDVIPGGAGPIVTRTCEKLRLTRPLLFARFCRDLLAPETFRNSGLGDLVLGFSWALPESLTGNWLVDLGADVKLPTASEADGLGTGKTDVTASLDVARTYGAVTPFAGLSYRFFGDPTLDDGLGTPITIDLEDGFIASAGLIFQPRGKTSLTLAYDYIERTVASSTASHEATLGLSVPIGNKGWRWSAYGVAGLTESSPDFALSLSFSYGF